MTKQDTILEHIIDIKEDIGGINQHLKDQNGRLERNELSIKGIHTRVNKLRVLMGQIYGGVATIGVIFGVIGAFVVSFIGKLK